MNLVYNIQDKPKLPQLLIFALQQVLAILGILTNILVSKAKDE